MEQVPQAPEPHAGDICFCSEPGYCAWFVEDLKRFHLCRRGSLPGCLRNFPPRLCGRPINLHTLFQAARSSGGLEQILSEGRWSAFWANFCVGSGILDVNGGERAPSDGSPTGEDVEMGVQVDCITCLYPYEQKLVKGRSTWVGEATVKRMIGDGKSGPLISRLQRQSTSSSSSSSSAYIGSEHHGDQSHAPADPLAILEQHNCTLQPWGECDLRSVNTHTSVLERLCSGDSQSSDGDTKAFHCGLASQPTCGTLSDSAKQPKLSDVPEASTMGPAVGLLSEKSEITEDRLVSDSFPCEAKGNKGRQITGDSLALRKCSDKSCREKEPVPQGDAMGSCAVVVERLKSHRFPALIAGQVPAGTPSGPSSASNSADLRVIQVQTLELLRDSGRDLEACGVGAPSSILDSLDNHHHKLVANPTPTTTEEILADGCDGDGTSSVPRSCSASPRVSCSSDGGGIHRSPWSATASHVMRLHSWGHADMDKDPAPCGQSGQGLVPSFMELSPKQNSEGEDGGHEESGMVCARVACPVRRPRSRNQCRKRKFEPTCQDEGLGLARSCLYPKPEPAVPACSPGKPAVPGCLDQGVIYSGGAQRERTSPASLAAFFPGSADGLSTVPQEAECSLVVGSPEELAALEVLTGLLCGSGRRAATDSNWNRDLSFGGGDEARYASEAGPVNGEDGAAASVLASLAVCSSHTSNCNFPALGEYSTPGGLTHTVHTGPSKANKGLSALLVHKIKLRSGACATVVPEPRTADVEAGAVLTASPPRSCTSSNNCSKLQVPKCGLANSALTAPSSCLSRSTVTQALTAVVMPDRAEKAETHQTTCRSARTHESARTQRLQFGKPCHRTGQVASHSAVDPSEKGIVGSCASAAPELKMKNAGETLGGNLHSSSEDQLAHPKVTDFGCLGDTWARSKTPAAPATCAEQKHLMKSDGPDTCTAARVRGFVWDRGNRPRRAPAAAMGVRGGSHEGIFVLRKGRGPVNTTPTVSGLTSAADSGRSLDVLQSNLVPQAPVVEPWLPGPCHTQDTANLLTVKVENVSGAAFDGSEGSGCARTNLPFERSSSALNCRSRTLCSVTSPLSSGQGLPVQSAGSHGLPCQGISSGAFVSHAKSSVFPGSFHRNRVPVMPTRSRASGLSHVGTTSHGISAACRTPGIPAYLDGHWLVPNNTKSHSWQIPANSSSRTAGCSSSHLDRLVHVMPPTASINAQGIFGMPASPAESSQPSGSCC